MSRRSRKPLPREPVRAEIESLSHDGRGVTRIGGKTVFVDGALPGEEVSLQYTGIHRRHDEGEAVAIHRASPDRVEPLCAHFGRCGGCALQHLRPEAQIVAKRQVLQDNLRHIGAVEPEQWLPPLTGPHWGYRNKARLGVKHVRKKGRVLVGFRERRSSFLADLDRCEVLHPSVGERLPELAQLVAGLDARDRIPQIEVAAADRATALVFRHLDPLSDGDRERLLAFARSSGFHVYLQPKGPDSATALWPTDSALSYVLPDQHVEIGFLPTDFTQVNPAINRAMVSHALSLLDPEPTDRVLDLFCGLGNFSLPIARIAARVTGVEGEGGLVARARANAARNGLTKAEFFTADLTQDLTALPWARAEYDKILIDPPRSGAAQLMPWIGRLAPARILYVSCHPGSLARDAGRLVADYGYRLRKAGVMDMFPHTAHVESIALFER